MSNCRTSTFDNHFDYRLIVLKDIQHGTSTRMHCVGWNVNSVCWNDVGVLDWDGVMHVWLHNCRRVSPWLSLGSICSVLFGTEWNTSITKSQRVRAGIPCMRKHASRKWFQLLLNCVILKHVSYTSNSLARTCDFRKCTEFLLMLILSLQGLLQNQSVVTIQVCIVAQCFSHNKIASIHL